MKKLEITFFIMIFWLSGFAQTYLVIDTNQTNLQIVKINEELVHTEINFSTLEASIDVDMDSIPDCIAKNDYTYWSYGWTKHSLNGINLLLVADTLVIGTVYEGNTWWLDTFTMVKKYNYGDTIWSDEHYRGFAHFTDCYYSTHSYYHYCIDHFNGIHYMGFKLDPDGQQLLGWIKIEVRQISLYLWEAGIYDPDFHIKEPSVQSPILYPNPTNHNVTFDNPGFSHFTIVDLMGNTVLNKPLIVGQQTISIGMLMPGIYVACFVNKEDVAYRKLVVK